MAAMAKKPRNTPTKVPSAGNDALFRSRQLAMNLARRFGHRNRSVFIHPRSTNPLAGHRLLEIRDRIRALQ
jgi:hypothetical protein